MSPEERALQAVAWRWRHPSGHWMITMSRETVAKHAGAAEVGPLYPASAITAAVEEERARWRRLTDADDPKNEAPIYRDWMPSPRSTKTEGE